MVEWFAGEAAWLRGCVAAWGRDECVGCRERGAVHLLQRPRARLVARVEQLVEVEDELGDRAEALKLLLDVVGDGEVREGPDGLVAQTSKGRRELAEKGDGGWRGGCSVR